MGKWVHRISNKNTETKIGDCANCGIVEIRLKSGYWICMLGAREGKRLAHEKRLYGKTLDRPDSCEVCGSTVVICYDHNHITGEFRGWLCSMCNLALGNARDSSDILRKLANYIDRVNNGIKDRN
jgi:hypothetical protein